MFTEKELLAIKHALELATLHKAVDEFDSSYHYTNHEIRLRGCPVGLENALRSALKKIS